MPFADDSFRSPQAQEPAQISPAQQDGKVFCGHGNGECCSSVEKSRNGALKIVTPPAHRSIRNIQQIGSKDCRNKGESKWTGNKVETKVKANGYETRQTSRFYTYEILLLPIAQRKVIPVVHSPATTAMIAA
jgi:hypothetical protein